MGSKQVVTFVRKHAPYNIGECAGFAPDMAQRLIQANVAVEGQRTVEGAAIRPDDRDAAKRQKQAAREPEKGDLVQVFVEGEGDVAGYVASLTKDTVTLSNEGQQDRRVPRNECRVVKRGDE